MSLELGKLRAQELGLEHPSKNELLQLAAVYRADDVHRLLGEGVEMQGTVEAGHYGFGNIDIRHDPDADTHKALLIGIRPIVKQEPRILNVDEADKISMKVFGLNARQIDELRCFYEAQTGFRADLIGVTGPPESEERKLLRELLAYDGSQIKYRGDLASICNRAKRLLDGDK